MGRTNLHLSGARVPVLAPRRSDKSIRFAFVTVTDRAYWAGTVATINSILEFHPDAEIHVIENAGMPLLPVQRRMLKRCDRVRLIGPRAVANRGWPIGGYELKAYACATLAQPPYAYDALVLIDSDALLCAPVYDQVQAAHQAGAFLGGKDYARLEYDKSYRVYGIKTPGLNKRHLSTSIMFCGLSQRNVASLCKWAVSCANARFNGTGPFPGDDDQRVLNAILYAEDKSARVRLLDNRLWSQHGTYWHNGVRFLEGCFLNPWVRNRPQRAFHTPGTHKFWSIEHSLKMLDGHSRQVFAYLWYLTMFWFGTCRDWSQDPLDYLPSGEAHLLEDLVTFLPQIAQVRPSVRADWERVSSVMLHRLLDPVAPGSHQKLAEIENIIDLIRRNPRIRRCVEMEGDEGTTGLALGLRFLNRDLDVFSIESFLDERQRPPTPVRVPSRLNFQQNLAQFPSARVKLIAGIPKLAASSFADGSVDLVVANGSQRVSYLRELLAAWRPKVSPGGFIAISGLRRDSRCTAIDSIFRQAHFKKGGAFWWKKS